MPPFNHASCVKSSLHIFHQRNHPRINLTHETLVTRIKIIIVDGIKPEERVVENSIYVLSHRVFATQGPDGALHDRRIEESIVIHQI